MTFSKQFHAAALLIPLVLAACSTPSAGPTTWIDRPLDGDQVAMELVTIQAHASDASGIGKFEFFINDLLLSSPTGSGARFSQAMVEWVPPAPDTYVVRARSVNDAGTMGPEAKAVIVVGNMTPTPERTATALPVLQVTATKPISAIEPAPLPVMTTAVTPTPSPTPGCTGVPGISTFTANPGTITAGNASTLIWGLSNQCHQRGGKPRYRWSQSLRRFLYSTSRDDNDLCLVCDWLRRNGRPICDSYRATTDTRLSRSACDRLIQRQPAYDYGWAVYDSLPNSSVKLSDIGIRDLDAITLWST